MSRIIGLLGQNVRQKLHKSSFKIAATLLVLMSLATLALYPPVLASTSNSPSNTREIAWLWSLNVSCMNATFCTGVGGPGLAGSTHYATATYYTDHSASISEVFTGFNGAGSVVFRTIEIDHITSWKIASGTNDLIYVDGTNTTSVLMNGQQHTTVKGIHDFDSGIQAVVTSVTCQQFLGNLGLPYCPENISIQVTFMKIS